jgi:hypothetical protein
VIVLRPAACRPAAQGIFGRSALACLAVLALVTIATPAVAQRHYADIRLDQYQPASAGSPFTRAEGPHERFEEGIAWGLRVTGDYGHKPLVSLLYDGNEEVEPVTLVEHAFLLHLGASIDPLHWLRGEVHFPFALLESGDPEDGRGLSAQDVPAGSAPAPGDLRVGIHFRPYSTKELDFSIGGRLWFPTGGQAGHDAFMTGKDDLGRGELVPTVAGEVDVILYGCTLGLSPSFFAGRDGDRLAASCAAHFKIAPFVSVGLEPHLALFSYADFDSREVANGGDREPGESTAGKKQAPGLGNASIDVQFEPMVAAMFRVGDFSVGLAVGAGVGDAPGTAAARALLTLQYASYTEPQAVERPPPDDDLDGIPNEYDACPDQAGPKSRRGCPAKRDADGDGILDGDACPDAPGGRHADPRANGCPDKDNDHYPDPIDPCPDEPGQETEGCPEHARLEKGQFVVTPPIAFIGPTQRLTNESKAALVEIVRTMRANPEIELLSVSIGTRGAPQRLTDLRAMEVLEVFDEQNFPSDRFEVVLSNELRSGQVSVKVIR